MPPRSPRLIVNADDFGYTEGVNRAVLELHQARAVTSTTLMATGAAFEDALSCLPQASDQTLGIGCHVVLVDGRPVLPAAELPSLTAPTTRAHAAAIERSELHTFRAEEPPLLGSRFRPTLGRFVADLLCGRIREAEIECEAIAQIRLLQGRGIRVTHLDTHKHTHIFARVLRPLLRAALHCGVRAIRNPFEPAWSLRATPDAPLLRRTEVRLLTLLRPEFKRLVVEAGLRTTDGAVGVLATGTLDARTLEKLIEAALSEALAVSPDATWELVCHPGYHDASLNAQATRLVAARETERAALSKLAPGGLKGFSLVHFGELAD